MHQFDPITSAKLSSPLPAWRDEAGRLIRFVLVGLANTAVGYGFILAGLIAGLGDYAANVVGFALGLPISYGLHRTLTFRSHRSATAREAASYTAAFAVAFGTNLGVIAIGRSLGAGGSAMLQAVAIVSYAAVLFVLTRLIVFRPR